MRRKLGLFLGAIAGLGLATSLPAWWLWGDEAFVGSLVALSLCALPMLATMLWAEWAFGQSPESQLAATLGGSGIRMAFVALAGIVLSRSVPMFEHPAFLMAVVGYYLATLTLEVVLLVRRTGSSS